MIHSTEGITACGALDDGSREAWPMVSRHPGAYRRVRGKMHLESLAHVAEGQVVSRDLLHTEMRG